MYPKIISLLFRMVFLTTHRSLWNFIYPEILICCIEGLRVLSKLRKLDLNYNRIYNIPHHVLRNLNSLETLSIAYNLISNLNGLPDNIFLISLICGGNAITSLNFKQPVFKEVSYVY